MESGERALYKKGREGKLRMERGERSLYKKGEWVSSGWREIYRGRDVAKLIKN